MKRKEEYPVERFTKEEIDIVNKVGRIVCHVFDVQESDLRSSLKTNPLPDARKVLSHYISTNIKLENFFGNYHVALATWYLNKDHSTICYAVQKANDLYETDVFFRASYDNVVSIINNPNDYQFIVVEKNEKPVEIKLMWEDVRRNPGYKNNVKMKLMPEKVSNRLKDMYYMGYSIPQIAYDIKATISFVKYYISQNDMSRLDIKARIYNQNFGSYSSPTKFVSTKIDY